MFMQMFRNSVPTSQKHTTSFTNTNQFRDITEIVNNTNVDCVGEMVKCRELNEYFHLLMQEYSWIITEMSVTYRTVFNRGLLLPAKECQVLLTADVWLQRLA
jgi:hypothetical protein